MFSNFYSLQKSILKNDCKRSNISDEHKRREQ